MDDNFDVCDDKLKLKVKVNIFKVLRIMYLKNVHE